MVKEGDILNGFDKKFEWHVYGYFIYKGRLHHYHGTVKEAIDMLVQNGIPRDIVEKELKK